MVEVWVLTMIHVDNAYGNVTRTPEVIGVFNSAETANAVIVARHVSVADADGVESKAATVTIASGEYLLTRATLDGPLTLAQPEVTARCNRCGTPGLYDWQTLCPHCLCERRVSGSGYLGDYDDPPF